MFAEPTLIDDATIRRIEELEELAPLHNASAIGGIRAAREALGPQLPMFAVFDTVFHRSIPPYARAYALTPGLTGWRPCQTLRFPRHLARIHARPLRAPDRNLPRPRQHRHAAPRKRLLRCAIRDGRSIDTSMGFTPLEGLVMGMRSGDIDPAIVGYFIRHKRMDIGRIEDLLNKHSGLLGLSGVSHNTRELMKHLESDDRVRFALEVFCFRARKYIGA